jgi:hypothetical protein
MTILQVLDLIIESVTYSSFALFGTLFILYVATTQPKRFTDHADNIESLSQLSLQELVNQADEILQHPIYSEPTVEIGASLPSATIANGYYVGFISQADPFSAQLVNSHQAFVADFWQNQYQIVQPPLRAAAAKTKSTGVRSSSRTSNAESLRKLCSANGIRWRNAQPNGKHLTVNQMRQVLNDKGVQQS